MRSMKNAAILWRCAESRVVDNAGMLLAWRKEMLAMHVGCGLNVQLPLPFTWFSLISRQAPHTFVHQKIFIAHHNFCVCTCGTKTVAAIVGKRVLRRFKILVSHCQLDGNS